MTRPTTTTTAPPTLAKVRSRLIGLADDLDIRAGDWPDDGYDAGVRSGLHVAAGHVRALAYDLTTDDDAERRCPCQSVELAELAVMGA